MAMPTPSTLAAFPVAGGQVVQHLLQAVGAQRGGELLLVEGVGEQVFDGLEAGLGSGLEALHEGQLGEEHRQVGGETRHLVGLL
jgi:hypothetical protein